MPSGDAPQWSKLEDSDDDEENKADAEKKADDEWEKLKKEAVVPEEPKDQKMMSLKKRKIHVSKELMDAIHGKITIEESAYGILADLPKMPKLEKPNMTYMTFDPTMCVNSCTIQGLYKNSRRFNENKSRFNQIEKIMIERYRKITPTVEQRAVVKQLQSKVTRAFEALLDTPLARTGALPLCAYAEVGSFAKRTVMIPNLTTDCAVIMKVKPTREAIRRVSEHFLIQYNRLNSVQLYRYDVESGQNVYLSDENTSSPLQIEFSEDGGFEVNNEEANCRIMVGCQKHKLNVGIETNLHINKHNLKSANAAVDHVKWFHGKVNDARTRILIVVLKDLCIRFESFRLGLNPRTIELLAFYAINEIPTKADTIEYLVHFEKQLDADAEDTVRPPLGLAEALVRILSILSSGFLTPDSSGMVDSMTGEPNMIDVRNQCPNGANLLDNRIHNEFEHQIMENLMATAQTLLRITMCGGVEKIFDPAMASTLERQDSVIGDTLIAPGTKIYK